LASGPLLADPALYNNDNPDGKIGTISRPSTPGLNEFETADDFVLTARSIVTGGSFTGLLPVGTTLSNIKSINVEIYKVQTTEIATKVPTRINSPTNDALFEQNTGSGLTFSLSTLNNGVGVVNSVDSTIKPGATSAVTVTNGDGPRVGEEARFDFQLTNPLNKFDLEKGQYFYVPQVELDNGNFLWLSANRPISGFGSTPTPAGFTDLQTWIRDEGGIKPDWERVGRDVIGPDSNFAATYNAAFRLNGVAVVVPEPTPIAMLIGGLLAVAAWSQRKRDRLS
jgi:hypothetical protein